MGMRENGGWRWGWRWWIGYGEEGCKVRHLGQIIVSHQAEERHEIEISLCRVGEIEISHLAGHLRNLRHFFVVRTHCQRTAQAPVT